MELNNNDALWINVSDLTGDSASVPASNTEIGIVEKALTEENSSFAANRRDFLKFMGFGLGAATVAASCEIPVRRAIPYVVKPDTIVPGVANYYASSYVQGGEYCPVLVKVREGRPIKIEGNALSKVTFGGTSARAQASVLGLYDTFRIQTPGKISNGKVEKSNWASLDSVVKSKLNVGSRIRIISNTIVSPTTKAAIADFKIKFPQTQVITYDPVSSSAILMANDICYGQKVIPDYKFDLAQVIVSFDADFLGSWISPTEYSAQYVKNRVVNAEKPTMSQHFQIESHMSLTGSNADNRILVKPSEQSAAIATLYNYVASITGGGKTYSAPSINAKADASFKTLAQVLANNKGKSLVVSGSNNVNDQVIINAINGILESIDKTVSFAEVNYMRQGDDAAVQNCISEMENGAVDAVFIWGANPSYELANAERFTNALKKVGLSVSFNLTVDETTANCQYSAPSHHFLESWGDANPKAGHYSLIQPTIAPLFDSRQPEVSLLTWAELAPQTEQPMYDYLVNSWKNNLFAKQKQFATFQPFWDFTLHNGIFETGEYVVKQNFGFGGNLEAAFASIKAPETNGVEVSFFETVNVGNGQFANNPWLLEMPDPVTRTSWGNTLTVPVKFDGVNDFSAFNNLKDGDKVDLEVNGKKYNCVVTRQFGQMENTVAIALGYGRTAAGYCSNYGTNVNAALPIVNGLSQYFATNVKVSNKLGVDDKFACVQYHHTMGVTAYGKEEGKEINADEKSLGWKGFQGSLVDRTIIRRSNLNDLPKLLTKLEEERTEHKEANAQTLYRSHQDKYLSGLHWGMHIDLNACTGCGSCTIACMAENNVPVVGKYEVHRHHEMSWLRIDRYYYGAVENPNVVYQPMMCQHCDNAPCENVCPVNATNHSSEGINQMTYNRCIGTRYCANNCPYKVRRFNWQDYTTADIFPWNERTLNGSSLGFSTDMPYGADNLTRMVLNPDVTVRSRGVIEKCSFCMQRIQEGKLGAKRENRQFRDSDVKTACQTACPTGAITFGNKNNKNSELNKLRKSDLVYRVLEEVNTEANVTYSAKIINKI